METAHVQHTTARQPLPIATAAVLVREMNRLTRTAVDRPRLMATARLRPPATGRRTVGTSYADSRLAQRRIALGLTQRDVAARIGRHHTEVSRLEGASRTPALPTLVRLAAALEVPLAEAVGWFVPAEAAD